MYAYKKRGLCRRVVSVWASVRHVRVLCVELDYGKGIPHANRS